MATLTSRFNKIFTKNNVYLMIGLLAIFIGSWTIMYLIPSVFVGLFDTLLGNAILLLTVLLTAKYNPKVAIALAILFVIFYQFSRLSKR
jgi:hypothetical protein